MIQIHLPFQHWAVKVSDGQIELRTEKLNTASFSLVGSKGDDGVSTGANDRTNDVHEEPANGKEDRRRRPVCQLSWVTLCHKLSQAWGRLAWRDRSSIKAETSRILWMSCRHSSVTSLSKVCTQNVTITCRRKHSRLCLPAKQAYHRDKTQIGKSVINIQHAWSCPITHEITAENWKPEGKSVRNVTERKEMDLREGEREKRIEGQLGEEWREGEGERERGLGRERCTHVAVSLAKFFPSFTEIVNDLAREAAGALKDKNTKGFVGTEVRTCNETPGS